MSYHGYAKTLFFCRVSILLIAVSLCLPLGVSAETEANNADKSLNEKELQSLQSTLTELRSLAPKLRVLLRTLRQRVGFNAREVHKIERSMSKSQKDLERMIAMHQRKAFNKLRAHFMVDDLRRKSEDLKEALNYVKRRIRELDDRSGNPTVDEKLKQSDDALVEQLGLYSNLVSESVSLLQEKGF